jgi:Cu-Zn family superoxide dismutase
MRKTTATALVGSVLVLAACQAQNQEAAEDVLAMENDGQAVPANGGMEAMGATSTGAGALQTAALRTADGQQIGTASVREEQGATVLTVDVNRMPAGTYGMHVHAAGKCEGPAFESAGPHWNPQSKQHGTQNPQGPHAGDLENLTIGQNGAGGATLTLSGTELRSGQSPMLDADGAALMIHAKADDYRTDPSGNSGDRIACAVLGGAPAS